MSDPIINYLKRESTCDNCYEKGHTSRKCTELMEIADENPTEDGLNFVMSFPLLYMYILKVEKNYINN